MTPPVYVLATSWPLRIAQIPRMVAQVRAQTVRPAALWLTLARDEFPDGAPADVAALEDGWFTVRWVERNTRTMKKVLPALPDIPDGALIIDIDDDIDVPRTLVEYRLRDWERNGRDGAVSSFLSPDPMLGGSTHFAACSLIPVEGLRHADDWVDAEVLATGNDDGVYDFLCWCNGVRVRYCSTLSYWTAPQEGVNLSDFGLPGAATYADMETFYRTVMPKVAAAYGVPFGDCFGITKRGR